MANQNKIEAHIIEVSNQWQVCSNIGSILKWKEQRKLSQV